ASHHDHQERHLPIRRLRDRFQRRLSEHLSWYSARQRISRRVYISCSRRRVVVRRSGMKATIAKNAAITRPNDPWDGCFASTVCPAKLALLATLFPPPSAAI